MRFRSTSLAQRYSLCNVATHTMAPLSLREGRQTDEKAGKQFCHACGKHMWGRHHWDMWKPTVPGTCGNPQYLKQSFGVRHKLTAFGGLMRPWYKGEALVIDRTNTQYMQVVIVLGGSWSVYHAITRVGHWPAGIQCNWVPMQDEATWHYENEIK